MDVIKMGKFIAQRRKAKGMTQAELGQRLHVTDRAVSKWECGRSVPDSSVMLDLCEILEISVNELLTGEELNAENYNQQAEQNLLEMARQKIEADKRLLRAEIVVFLLGAVVFAALVAIGAACYFLVSLPLWGALTITSFGFLVFLFAAFFAVRIEQKVGYYECNECGHRHTPSYVQTLFAPHVNRKRYMRCPCCGKKSWQKKVLADRD